MNREPTSSHDTDSSATDPVRSRSVSAALLSVLFAQSPDAILIADIDGRYLDGNAAAFRLLGYSREDLLLLRLEDVVVPGPTWTPEAYGRFIQSGFWEGEVSLRASDGATIPTEARTHVVTDDGAGVTITVFRDLSERRENESTRARLAALIASSADAVIGETLDGIVTDWNPTAERLYGYRAEEITGQQLAALVPPERLPEANEILARARAGEGSEGVETYRFTRDGRRIDISLTVSPVWNDARQIIGTSAIVRDITERKATERALAMSERRFRTAFEDAPIGMALVSLEGHILQANRAVCAMLGYSDDELVSRTVEEISHPDELALDDALAERALAGEFRTYTMEKRFFKKDGTCIWALVSISLVHDEAGNAHFIAHVWDITDQKAAQDELAATHQHTTQVLERITDGFLAVDLDWNLTYINREAERISALNRDDALGADLWSVMPGLRETPLYAAYHQTMADGASRTVEYFHPPGKRWFDIRLYPSPEGLSIFVRDVTESRMLTQELRASEARYRTLVDQLPAVVYSTSAADERITYFSPYLYEMTGYRPDEVLAEASDWHWLEFIHPEDRDRVAGEDEADVPTDQPIRLEYRIARKDGGTLWVRDESLPIHDETGAIVAWQGILMDITDRIEAEEARARLAALVDSADDAIISRTLDGVITSWNHGAEQMYGYRAEEVIGKPLAFLLPEEDPGSALVPAERLSDQPMHFEGTRWRRDGSAFAASIALSPIRDRNGMLIGISSITRDISAQKRADEELRAALEAAQAGIRAKSLFLAMMSHELRTPLQAVLGYADFLLNGPPGSLSPEQREDVSYIHQGAGRMVTLIEQMLDLSRMEAGRLEIASEPVELAKLVEQVRQDVGPQVTAKSLEFAIDVSPTLPPVLGDPVRLRQILLNLVGNAVKFTEAGSVRIGAAATEQSVTVTVRDTGIGIAPEALPFIFEEFRQVDGNMTRRYGGAGLGLAIAKRLAEQMGGSISVESAPGAGSTFTLRLPAARPTRRRRRLTRDA